MKRKNDDTISRVYTYGIIPPINDPNVSAEIEKQRKFWDVLVGIDRLADDKIEKMMRADIAEYENNAHTLDRINQEFDELIQERRDIRKTARSKVATPMIDNKLDELAAKRRELWKEQKTLLTQWYKTHKSKARQVDQWRYDQIKTARNESGLYWGNSGRVIQSYDSTRKRVRKQGRRLQYSDPQRDDAVLSVQIIRTRSGLGAAPEELFNGSVNALQIGYIDESIYTDKPNVYRYPHSDVKTRNRKLVKTKVQMRVDRDGNIIQCPMWLHRPLPPNSRIKFAQLVWRRQGHRYVGQLCLTVNIPTEIVKHPSKKAVGVDPGWRLMDDHTLRIAMYRDTDGNAQDIRLDKKWMEGMDQVERLHSYVDEDLIAIAEYIHKNKDNLPESVYAPVSQWASNKAASHIDGRALHDAVYALHHSGEQIPKILLKWYHRYRHLAHWRNDLRTKLMRRRKEQYRLIAKHIAQTYAVIGIEDIDLAQMARTISRYNDTNELSLPQREQRRRAALYEFISILQEQATKHGSEIVWVDGKTTRMCRHCGNETGQKRPDMLHWLCESCGELWDQDVNASENILCAAVDAASTEVVVVSDCRKSKYYGDNVRASKKRSQKGG